jgi:hypothetical protein
LELVAFAAHGLHQDAQVQDTAAEHQQSVGAFGLLDAHRQVLLDLLEETVAHVAAGHELAFLAEERRVVDGEEHAHGGFVHLELGQAFGVLGIGNGIADIEILQAHQGHDLAAANLVLHFSLPRPSNTISSFTWPFWRVPSFFTKVMCWPGLMLPRVMRPTAMRPWKLL